VLSVADFISSHALSDLIGSICACALDPSRWDQTLLNINDALDGHTAILSLSNVRHGRPVIMKAVGLEPRDLPTYCPMLTRSAT
jgi:hypothetical protein